MTEDHVAYPCPYCGDRSLETAVSLPYVRGYVLAFHFGSKKIIGCRSCVRKQVLKETGISGAIGWFSPTAMVSNPFLLAYGLARSAWVTRNPAAVRKQLANAGIPEVQGELSLVRIGYSLAASMIAADRKIEPQEVATAADIGSEIFRDFDKAEFNKVVANHKNLPEPAELAALLKGVLTDEGKDTVYGFLLAIASSDDDLAAEERELLEVVAENMQLRPVA